MPSKRREALRDILRKRIVHKGETKDTEMSLVGALAQNRKIQSPKWDHTTNPIGVVS